MRCFGLLALILMLSAVLSARDGDRAHDHSIPHRLYHWSIAALVAGNTMDMVSSVGMEERNPVLGRGAYGMRQTGIKTGIIAAGLITQRLAMRSGDGSRSGRTAFTVGNFAIGGVTAGVAARNWRVKR